MLIILDRDGVINEDSPNYIKHPDEWHAIPGSLEIIARWKQQGHVVCVATNQSGIARQYYDLKTLQLIHQKMHHALAALDASLDGIFFCPHVDADQCLCRKPKPGLLLQTKQRFPSLWHDAVFIGDSTRDYEAAVAASCSFILVGTGNGHQSKSQLPHDVPFFNDLASVKL